jgi:hypothetical protein
VVAKYFFRTVSSGDPMEEADIWRFDIYQPSKSSKDEIKKTIA